MQLGATLRRLAAISLLLVGAAVLASSASAQVAYSVGQSRGDGYTFEGENGWPVGQGYRPVRVRLRSGKVTGDDRRYTIEVENQDYYRRKTTTTSGTLVIPAGARVGEAVLTVPMTESVLQHQFHVYEDGRHLQKLDSYASSNLYAGASLNLPSFLCITDKTIDTSLLMDAMELNNNNQPGMVYYGGQNIINGKQQYPAEFFTQVPIDKLPTGWTHYSSPDVICLHVDDLVKLDDARPDVLKAIRQAVSAGGNLWIWGVGQNFERLREIEERTELWNASAPPWQDPNPAKYAQGLDGEFSVSRSVDYSMPGMPVTASENVTSSSTNKTLSVPQTMPFRMRDAQLGMVLVFAADRPIGSNPASQEEIAAWVWATNTVGADRMLSRKRQGLSVSDDNPDFWNQMIPGVGKAPVTAFRVLITGFVLAIGPLNYYWLRRKGKLHLLLAVVPITALVVTAGLFGYAMLTDGLQTRVRPRTFTSIDQSRQQVVSLARVTYYAGLSPAAGLQFEDDTMVLPIDPKASVGMAWRRRSIAWEGNRQRLASGWLASRTPTQFLLTRSRATTNGLRITPAVGDAPPTVVNGLGANIEHLFLCDERDKLYHCGATARGDTCKLEEVTAAEQQELARYFKDRDAVQLQDMQLTENSYTTFGATVYYYGQSSEPASQSTGLLEKSLRHAANVMTTPAKLPPRSYLAVVDQSPEVDYGVETVQQELPLHVIQGQW